MILSMRRKKLTLRQTATCAECAANVCLSILAAAALHGEEAGEAEDGDQDRADGHRCREVRIGKLSLLQRLHPSSEMK